MKNLKTISALFAAFSMMFVMSASQAITYSFENVKNNSSIDLSTQLFADVTEFGTEALIRIRNDVDSGSLSSITDIYFGYDSEAFDVSFHEDSGDNVAFSDGATPSNLSGGTFTADYSTDADPGSPDSTLKANGVNETDEWISFLVDLGSVFNQRTGTWFDTDFAYLLNAIDTGEFGVGLHVQAISTSDISDSYEIGPPNVVPVPAAAWLFGTALFGFFAASRRKKIS